MSRSYRRVKIFPIAGNSDKEDKRKGNRVLRRAVKIKLRFLLDLFPLLREVCNPYSWNKDGKRYWPNATKKDMSK